MGTNCQNQPEVHAITQALRAVARIACPAVLFKAEAIVAPQDLVHYLGQGAHHGKVSDIAYHNSLMVQVWSMIASQDVTLAAHALREIPPVPSSTTWVTYIRCHDDIGWAIDDNDAAAVGLNGFWHRSFLSDYYCGSYPGSPASGLVFQANPVTGDRRISGTAASLVGPGDRPLAGRDRPGGRAFVPRACDCDGLGRHPGGLDGRRDRDGQRPGLGRRAGTRGRQPLGASAADELGGRRAPPRPANGRRSGVLRHPAPRRSARLAAASRGERRRGGGADRGSRGAAGAAPAPARPPARAVQHHRQLAAVPRLAVGRARARRRAWMRCPATGFIPARTATSGCTRTACSG